MRQITNSIKCLIVFGIWLLGFNTLSACNIKLKIVYTQADLRTIFDITPELFDKGLISHSLDSINRGVRYEIFQILRHYKFS